MNKPMRLVSVIRTWLGNNYWLKLFALLGAVGVWWLASRGVYIRKSRVVPVSLKLAPEMTVRSITPSAVKVILDYPQEKRVTRKEEEEDIKVIHDLTEATEPGKIVFTVTGRDVKVPYRIRVVGIEPSRINAEIDRRVEKVLPVKVIYRGTPRAGYRIAGETVIPPEVVVPGPEGVLRNMKAIETEPIGVMGRSNYFEVLVPLKPVSPLAEAPLAPVSVSVAIAPELQTRRMAEVPVAVLKGTNQTVQITLEPNKTALYLKGQEKPLKALTQADIKAYVEIIGLETGSYELPLKTELPKEIELQRADPSIIKVILGRGQPGLLEPAL
jgi:YbbR domain-containing protein